MWVGAVRSFHLNVWFGHTGDGGCYWVKEKNVNKKYKFVLKKHLREREGTDSYSPFRYKFIYIGCLLWSLEQRFD